EEQNPTHVYESSGIFSVRLYVENGAGNDYLEKTGLVVVTWSGDLCTEYDLSESAIVTNDFWITADDLDIIPFAVSEGDAVFTADHVFLPVVDTVSTATGNVSIVNVKGQTVVGVKDTPYTNAGDCKVWDTVTPENMTESTWERVYDTDHLFTGDCVLDNGIIRLITHVNDEFYRIGLLYLYTNNNWVFIKEIRARTYPTVYALNSISATVISPEKVEILGQTSAYSRYLAISKGSFSLEIYGGSGSEILFEGEPEISDSRFLYWGNLRDVYADIHEDEDWYQSDNHYLALINPESSFIWYVSSSISPEYYGLTTPELVDAVHIIPNTEELKGYIGAIPHDCSKLFYEAESMALIGSGEQPYNGDFIGISLTLVNDGVQCSNTLDPGIYTVYARVKSSLTESNAGRFHIRYYTPDMVNISDNSVSTSGTIEYLSDTFTVPQDAVGHPIFISFIKYTNSANQLDVDYLLIVPTKLIEKHVESVLYQLSPMTKQLKYVDDVREKVPPDIPSVPTVNLLDNASFESGEIVSHGWSYENYAKGTPIYSKSITTGVVDGSLAQQLSYTGVEEDGKYSAVVCYQAPVYVTGGYKVDFYIHICGTLENCKLVYGIESKDINNESISYIERIFKSLPNSPTQILVSYVCPGNAYFLVAYLKFEDLVSPSSSFTAYIDNAKLLSEDGCIPWCGVNWRAQMGTDQAPADNNWSRSPNNVWVDEDNKLHMTIKNDDGAWNCTELRTSPILFGKFTWTIESPIFNLDKNAIFGLFLYTDDTHEIDIEISRWTADQNDLILYSVQPSEVEGNSTGYVPSVTIDGITTAESGYSGSDLTCQIDWQPDYINWKAWDNNGNIIAEKHYTDVTQIPKVALELRMNLWLKHAIPVDGNDIEIVISRATVFCGEAISYDVGEEYPVIPFEPLVFENDTYTFSGFTKFVLFTDDSESLLFFNQFFGNTQRCSLTETPCGGAKNVRFSDMFPGTVSIENGNYCYLKSSGGHVGKVLSAGHLAESQEIITSGAEGIAYCLANGDEYLMANGDSYLVTPPNQIVSKFQIFNASAVPQICRLLIRCPNSVSDIKMYNRDT
ncbi:MAG: hypothetical protein PHF68_03745, partial [Candidatus ainarchaeum sp.]|nr:hypothetical protein [Candidatus ainarchaeum sp.]